MALLKKKVVIVSRSLFRCSRQKGDNAQQRRAMTKIRAELGAAKNKRTFHMGKDSPTG